MKKLLYLFLLFLPVLGFAQSRYGVEGVPVCWRTPLGVDSSLNRYVIISSTGKPVQTIVYENANGVVVNVSGGSMRYGYCDCIDFTVPDSSVTWEMLTEPVKDSIRFAKRDTFITVPPSENYFQNLIENPAKFYNNIYFSCKGRTDTSIVVFLAAPVVEEQKGVVYHIKNDSGLVAAFVINYEHLSNNKRFYLLQRGQTAQVRLLPDAASGGDYRWAVNVVWDSIGGGGGNGIYGGSDSLSQENTYAAMAVDGSQSFGLGNFSIFPDYTSGDYGLLVSPAYQNAILLLDRRNSYRREMEISDTYIRFRAQHNTISNRRSIQDVQSGALVFSVGSGSDKFWNIRIDTTKFQIIRNISGIDRTYELLPASDYPSTTETNILKWLNGVPSFGYRYESDDLFDDVYITGNNKNFDLEQVKRFSLYTEFDGGDGYWEFRNDSTAFYWGMEKNTPAFQSFYAQYVRAQHVYTIFMDSLSKNMRFIHSPGGLRINNGTTEYQYIGRTAPSVTPGAISNNIWTAGTPSFLRSQHKTISGTTDGSGDITIIFDAAMPDATYTVIVTGQGATPYVYMTQSATLATGSVKVRMFTLAGAAATSTAYQISYEVKDTN